MLRNSDHIARDLFQVRRAGHEHRRGQFRGDFLQVEFDAFGAAAERRRDDGKSDQHGVGAVRIEAPDGLKLAVTTKPFTAVLQERCICDAYFRHWRSALLVDSCDCSLEKYNVIS